MSAQPVPIFDPQGVLRDVPYEQMPAAVKAGGMPAVKFMAPDKSIRFVPANKTQDAYKAGGTVLPFEDQEVKHPGFWATLLDDAKGMASGTYHALADPDLLADPSVPDSVKNALVERQQTDAAAKIAGRKAQGYGSLYSEVSAPANEMLGVNVSGMEQSAKEGDSGGVMGHAAAVPIAMAASDLAARTFNARLAKAVEVPPEAIAKAKPSADLDATGENKPYAGAPRPIQRPWNYNDATGENRDFAGERTPPRTVVSAPQVAIPPRMAVPEAAPIPQPTPLPGSAGSMVRSIAKDTPPPVTAPLEDRMAYFIEKVKREHAAGKYDGPASAGESETESAPSLEDDLTPLLLKSLEHVNNLKHATP
jgi:hypothetical protein